jgi:hypothetical protein
MFHATDPSDKRVNMKRCVSVLATAIVLFAVGCGESGPKTYWVTGAVTLNHKSLADGDVIFYPKNKTKSAAMGKINQGVFRFQVVAGEHRVVIQASRPSPTRKGATGRPAYDSIIPDRYNTHTQLTAQVHPDGDNRFDFSLTR